MKQPLTAEDRERLEVLFDLASEMPQEEHEAFIERECGSRSALRDELTRLLAGLAGEDILEQLRPQAPTRVGTTIGPYELLERVGEGGMGDVYAAQQHEPIERRVALKVIKAGMDSAQVVARFEAERQTLALMQHDNIARILDGGTTADGRPYFVMEFVEGAPISEYCDQHKLSMRARIELFLGICEGVQHAHQKGVIHRDLKPSNLLVTEQGGRVVPKIIDFGVARATSGRLADRTLLTMLGQVVGTLDYMSPEQADPSAVDVDTRSDIYSLGVVLYQLLSGLLPFDKQLGTDVPLSEAQRILRELDPPTPSTRIRRQSGTALRIAPLRGTSEQALLRQLSGDLDWICLKALEKDPARRYQSASELAADLRRHLENKPVLAARPGRLYLARKFVRRHRVGMAAGFLVSVSSLAGLTGWIAGELEAEVQAQVARNEAAKSVRLIDMQELERLEADAESLWPPTPDQIPEYVAWMERAREVLARREVHEASLAEIESRCAPWTEELKRKDSEQHPRAEQLAIARAELAFKVEKVESGGLKPAKQEQLLKRIAKLEEQEIPALLEAVQVRQSWGFAGPEDARWHPQLEQLIAQMDFVEATFLDPDRTSAKYGWSLPKRLELARQLERDVSPSGEHFAAWAAALPQIHAARADMDGDGTSELVYPGLELTMQMGLVPLGPDPDSHLWEFAVLLSGDPVARDADGELIMNDSMAVVLVLLPEGSFTMGAQFRSPDRPHYDRDALPDEGPPHEVHVPGFFISKFELTESQWFHTTRQFPRDPGRGAGPSEELLPVDSISWKAALAYSKHLGLTLPDEGQWEYSARAGADTIWSTGSDDELSLEGYANLFDLTALESFPLFERESSGHSVIDDGYATRSPVGALLPNSFGLHDVHGNIAEWCRNTPYMYPTAFEWLVSDKRVSRGGNARASAIFARSSARRFGPADIKGAGFGFRPSRPIAD